MAKFNSNTVKPGEIYDEADVYSYVRRIHANDDDFELGDLGTRIENYKKYKVEYVNISDLNLDRFYIDDYTVEKYKIQYEKYKAYLPIVVDADNEEIIDGNHRANALSQLGLDKILAFRGLKSSK